METQLSHGRFWFIDQKQLVSQLVFIKHQIPTKGLPRYSPVQANYNPIHYNPVKSNSLNSKLIQKTVNKIKVALKLLSDPIPRVSRFG